MDTNTDEFLAIHLPHLKPLKGWLKYLNSKLGWLKANAKGNAQMHVQWNGGSEEWTEWTYRERPSKKQ